MKTSKYIFLSALILLLFACDPTLAQSSGPPAPSPTHFQKAMIFVDGTNLFYRLETAKIIVPKLWEFLKPFCNPRDVVRIYLYTIREQLARAKTIHGESFCEKIRLVFGEGVPTKDGNFKEKGVDALLVADLIYHAANKNCDYALLVSTDTDFVQPLKRVEDFGCRTGVLAVGVHAPDPLRMACDDYRITLAG